MHEEKVKTSEDLLRRRELAVKTMEDTYNQRLKNELSRYFNRCLICTVSLWPTLSPQVGYIFFIEYILPILLVHFTPLSVYPC